MRWTAFKQVRGLTDTCSKKMINLNNTRGVIFCSVLAHSPAKYASCSDGERILLGACVQHHAWATGRVSPRTMSTLHPQAQNSLVRAARDRQRRYPKLCAPKAVEESFGAIPRAASPIRLLAPKLHKGMADGILRMWFLLRSYDGNLKANAVWKWAHEKRYTQSLSIGR